MMFAPKKTVLSMTVLAVIAFLFVHSVRIQAASVDGGVATPVVAEKVAIEKKCVPRSICFKDSDCGAGEKGSECLGAFVGKCNCDACVSGTPCFDDSACGGLKAACDSDSGLCDCVKGLQENGYPTYGDALVKLCNVRECHESTTDPSSTLAGSDECSGLPCRAGRCHCAK